MNRSGAVLAALLVLCPWLASACWTGGLTPDLCCDLKVSPRGNPVCFDEEYTFERCCGEVGGSPKASPEVKNLRIDTASVPLLTLPGGGRMPIAGLGLCCRPTANGDPVRQAVVDYLLMGGRHLDDASLYSNHREVGLGIRQAVELGVPRNEIFFTTKIWPSDYGFEAATEWVDTMLKELELDYVDLVLLHLAKVGKDKPCGTPKQCRQETWLALTRAQTKGQIRNLGVSNFGARQMGELLDLGGAPITANQFEYHPWVPKLHKNTAEWCHQHGIAVTAYGSMGSGNLAGQVLSQEGLQQIGNRHGKTSGQVLLRWAVQKNVSVIPGTSNPKHMAENLRIFDFRLSGEEMAILDGIPEENSMLHFGHEPDKDP